MLYFHKSACICAQQTFGELDLHKVYPSVENKLHALEPKYPDVPPAMLRRMGKAVRISVGAAYSLIKDLPATGGIVLGTGIGGMEDSVKFLKQIMHFNEGLLTPAEFVQSTANAIASQIGLISANRSYNMTHVHRGLAFENALVDCAMLAQANREHLFLVGGADEISNYNHHIEFLDGWYKNQEVSNLDLYRHDSPGSLAGESAVMFLVGGQRTDAVAKLVSIRTFHGSDVQELKVRLAQFLALEASGQEHVDLLISGENGDNRLTKYYLNCEEILGPRVQVARYKHLVGEHPTAGAVGVWLACQILVNPDLPVHLLKYPSRENVPKFRKILVYNCYKAIQHSLIMIESVPPLGAGT